MMNSSNLARLAMVFLSMLLPAAVYADIAASVILRANEGLDLDTGAIDSNGDILWNGSTITPQGGARIANISVIGATAFSVTARILLSAEVNTARTNPIAGRQRTVAPRGAHCRCRRSNQRRWGGEL